jgi:hypothetical protein
MADTTAIFIGTGDGGTNPQPFDLKRAGILCGEPGELFKGR